MLDISIALWGKGSKKDGLGVVVFGLASANGLTQDSSGCLNEGHCWFNDIRRIWDGSLMVRGGLVHNIGILTDRLWRWVEVRCRPGLVHSV